MQDMIILKENTNLTKNLYNLKLKSDELDDLFQIKYDLNYDSRRVRRSRIIRDLNMEYQKLEGKDIIMRQKDPKDKRYIIFRIEK
jgi:predicted nucleotidyltransferase